MIHSLPPLVPSFMCSPSFSFLLPLGCCDHNSTFRSGVAVSAAADERAVHWAVFWEFFCHGTWSRRLHQTIVFYVS